MRTKPPALPDIEPAPLPLAIHRDERWVCAACGCPLQSIPAMRRREFVHRQGTEGRDANGCRVACVGQIHRG